MTLVAGFRSRSGGVLLCADREEGDGYSKRSVDKIAQLNLQQCKIFIAGAGASGVIKKAILRIGESLKAAENEGIDLRAAHESVIEDCLEELYRRYITTPEREIGLVIVVAPYGFENRTPPAPLMYLTERAMLVPAHPYASHGNGRGIADYLADRMYQYGVDGMSLTCLAAFIFREAAHASAGVGLGTDMVMIFDGDRCMRYRGSENIKELESCIPSLGESVSSHWKENLKVPESLTDGPLRDTDT